jgi:hypothetical protein
MSQANIAQSSVPYTKQSLIAAGDIDIVHSGDGCELLRLNTPAACLWAANDAYYSDTQGKSPERRWCTDKEIKANEYLAKGPLYYIVDNQGPYVWQFFPWEWELESQFCEHQRPFKELCDPALNPGIVADWPQVRRAMQNEIADHMAALDTDRRLNAMDTLLLFGVEDMDRQTIDIFNRQLRRLSGHNDANVVISITPMLAALASQMDEPQIAFAHETIDLLAADGMLHSLPLHGTVFEQPVATSIDARRARQRPLKTNRPS